MQIAIKKLDGQKEEFSNFTEDDTVETVRNVLSEKVGIDPKQVLYFTSTFAFH